MGGKKEGRVGGKKEGRVGGKKEGNIISTVISVVRWDLKVNLFILFLFSLFVR